MFGWRKRPDTEASLGCSTRVGKGGTPEHQRIRTARALVGAGINAPLGAYTTGLENIVRHRHTRGIHKNLNRTGDGRQTSGQQKTPAVHVLLRHPQGLQLDRELM